MRTLCESRARVKSPAPLAGRAWARVRGSLAVALATIVIAAGTGPFPALRINNAVNAAALPASPGAPLPLRAPLSSPLTTPFLDGVYPGTLGDSIVVGDIATGDLNGDGNTDMAATVQRGAANSIGVVFGDGAGGWSAPVLLPTTAAGGTSVTPGSPAGIVMADFDGDGDKDLAVSVPIYSPRVLSWINRGDGTFTRGASTPLPTITAPNALGNIAGRFDAYALGAADMNGDGRPDVVTSPDTVTFGDQISGRFAILTTPPGAWDGSFAAPAFFDAPNVTSVTLADLDRDGRMDVVGPVYGGNGGNAVRWWRNIVGTPGGPVALAGDPFAATPGGLAGSGAIAEAGFAPLATFDGGPHQGTGPSDLNGIGSHVADLNGDGILDIAVIRDLYEANTSVNCCAEGRYALRVLTGGPPDLNGMPTFTGSDDQFALGFRDASGVGSFPTAPFDADRDGDLDIIMPAGAGRTAIARNDGHGHFTPETYAAEAGGHTDRSPDSAPYPGAQLNGGYGAGTSVSMTRAADVDGDGTPDLLPIMTSGNNGGVSVVPSVGHPIGAAYGGTQIVASGLPLRNAQNTHSVVTADWDGNGTADLLAPGGPTGVMVSPGDGHGGFGPAGPVPGAGLDRCAPDFYTQLVVVDLDHDGHVDIVCGTYDHYAIGFGSGDGSIAASTTTAYPLGWASVYGTDVFPVDVNGDGTLDLATLLHGPDGIRWAPAMVVGRALGTPVLGEVVSNNGGFLSSFAVGAFDADPALDVVVLALPFQEPAADQARPIVSSYDIGPDTNISNRRTVGTLGRYQSTATMVAADLNGDGRLDLVSQTGNAVKVLLNDGAGGFTMTDVYHPGFSNNRIALDDIDGDGKLDMYGNTYTAIGFNNSQYEVEILFGNGDGTFAVDRPNRQRLSTALIGGGIAGMMHVDVDGDHRPDLVIAENGAADGPNVGNVAVFRDLGGAASRQPDLVTTAIAVSGSPTIDAGEERTITATVANNGLSRAATIGATAFFLSADAVWSPDDRLLGTVPASGGALGPASTRDVQLTTPIVPSAPGDTHIIVRVDARGEVPESDEANLSAASATINVVVAPLTIGRGNPIAVPAGGVRYYRLDDPRALALRTDRPDAAVIDVVRGALPVPARQLQMPAAGALALPAGAGVWFVRVEGRAAGAIGGAQHIVLTPAVLTFGVLGVSPGRGSNLGQTTITVDGRGLDGATAHIGGLAPIATTTSADGTRLIATFDLVGQAPGLRDVVMTKGAAISTLVGAFVITTTPPGGLQLYADMIGRARLPQRVPGLIQARNTGDTDIPSAFLKLAFTGGTVSIDGGPPVTSAQLWTDAPGVAPGILPAGKTVSIPMVVTPGGDYQLDVQSFEPGDPAPGPSPPAPGALVSTAGEITGLVAELPLSARAAIASRASTLQGSTTGEFIAAIGRLRRAGISVPDLAIGEEAIVDEAVATTTAGSVGHGVVVTEAGTAVVGAIVRAEGGAMGRTASDGRFSLFGPLPTAGTALAVDDHVVAGGAGAADEMRIITSPGASLVVAVADAATPVAHALISAMDSGGTRHEATTGPDGHGTLRGLAGGSVRLSVSAAEHAVATRTVDASAVSVDVAITRLVELSGSVAPIVAGVTVTAGSGLGATSTVTAADGTWHLRVPGGQTALTASVDRRGAQATAIAPGATVVLALVDGGTLTGTVRAFGSGAPLASAAVVLASPTNEIDRVTTGPDGTYRFTRVPTGVVQVTATPIGYAATSAPTSVLPGANATVDLVATQSAVTDATRAPTAAEGAAQDLALFGPPVGLAPPRAAVAVAAAADVGTDAGLGGHCAGPVAGLDATVPVDIGVGSPYATFFDGSPFIDGVPAEIWARNLTAGEAHFRCYGRTNATGFAVLGSFRVGDHIDYTVRARRHRTPTYQSVVVSDPQLDLLPSAVLRLYITKGLLFIDDPVEGQNVGKGDFDNAFKLPEPFDGIPLDLAALRRRFAPALDSPCPQAAQDYNDLLLAAEIINKLKEQSTSDIAAMRKAMSDAYNEMYLRVVEYIGKLLAFGAGLYGVAVATLPVWAAGVLNFVGLPVTAEGFAILVTATTSLISFVSNLAGALRTAAITGQFDFASFGIEGGKLLVTSLTQQADLLSTKLEFAPILVVASEAIQLIKDALDGFGTLQEVVDEAVNIGHTLQESIKTRKRFIDRLFADYHEIVQALLRREETHYQEPCDKVPTKRRRLYGAILRSSDPNDIAGPAGVGLGRYIAPGQLAYRIDFENVGVGTEHIPAGRAAGTAPAATVTITETLDADLDPATLALGVMEIGVDGGAYPKMTFVPPPNVQAYSETRRVTVPVYGTAEHVAIDVRVTASLAPDTGVVSWAFEAIDPMTGLTPADPLIGLLPPEPVTPEGLGHGSVEYSVAARAGLATGTQIDAQARVVFDQEAPLDTPTWRNTVDVDPPVPTGLVDGRGAGPSVAVSWDSTDLGAGVDVFDVFVGDGVAPLRPWKVASTARNGMYVGEVGHTYRFAVRAADLVGNTDGILHAAVVDAPATTDPSAPPAAAPPPPPPAPPEVVPVTDLGPRLANLSYQGGRRPYPSGIVRFLVDLQASQGANRQVRVLKRTAAKTRRRPERFVQLGALTLDAYGDGRFSFRTPKPAQGDIYVVVDAVTGAELYRAKIFSKR